MRDAQLSLLLKRPAVTFSNGSCGPVKTLTLRWLCILTTIAHGHNYGSVRDLHRATVKAWRVHALLTGYTKHAEVRAQCGR